MNTDTLLLLEKLATKLGVATEYLWGTLLRQAPINSIIGLTTDVIILVCLYITWKKALKISFDKWDGDFGKGVLYTGLIFTSFLVLMFSLGALPLEIAGLINPEYWALQQILKLK